MRRLLIIVVAALASSAPGQFIVSPTAVQYDGSSGLVVDCKMGYLVNATTYPSVASEWYAVIAPGLTPWGPSIQPTPFWAGPGVPLGLQPQFIATPLPSPSGPVLDPFSGTVTGVAIPLASTFGGCAFGYVSSGLWRRSPPS